MRLYHFINEKYGLENLREKRLKITQIEDLNDPFEFRGMDLSDPELRRAMEGVIQDTFENKGIHCFSKGYDSPAQWAHYADGHKGLCLGFDFLGHSGLIKKVKYVRKPLSTEEFLAATKAFRDKPLDGEARRRWEEKGQVLMDDSLATKFSHWSYEKEYRLFAKLEGQGADGLYYSPFSDELKLKEVIVGVCSSVTRAKIKKKLGEMVSGVNIFKVRAAFDEFAMEKDTSNTF